MRSAKLTLGLLVLFSGSNLVAQLQTAPPSKQGTGARKPTRKASACAGINLQVAQTFPKGDNDLEHPSDALVLWASHSLAQLDSCGPLGSEREAELWWQNERLCYLIAAHHFKELYEAAQGWNNETLRQSWKSGFDTGVKEADEALRPLSIKALQDGMTAGLNICRSSNEVRSLDDKIERLNQDLARSDAKIP